ncbi:extensin-like domain-containing protein [Oryzicola mucosus]|uniref:extensin-like domain-containing protein n=1 Tax=Oryzicola mucosus TaxID=2767425 RepID=UPI001E2C991B|nr:extensin family protein [Oryzicola mucosus]
MAAQSRAANPAGRFRRARISLLIAGTVLAGLAVSACTTGDVFSLEPAVDVGTQTAAVVVPEQPVPAPIEVAPVDVAPVQPDPVEVAPVQPYPTEPAPVQAATPRAGVGMQTLVPSNPMMVAYPPVQNPTRSAPTNALNADDVECRRDLKKLGVVYRELGRVGNGGGGGGCGIDNAVQVSSINGVKISPAATLTCDMASSLGMWTRRELVPAARLRYWSGVKTIHQGSSYSCRRIAGSRTLSAHGEGNAIDIMRIELNNGSDIEVRKPGLFAFRQRGLLNTVRADGCQYFTTVLGPGYNAAHADHFHFDLMKRRNGYRACK